MEKDYARWHQEKKRLNGASSKVLFQERDIWWCKLGLNIGYEQDGNPYLFTRPVVILRKMSADTALVVPLTTRMPRGEYEMDLGIIAGRSSTALLQQLRFVDRRRFTKKIGKLKKPRFQELLAAIIRAITI